MSAPDYAKYTLDEVKKALAGLDEDADYEKIKKLEAQKMFLRVERHSQMKLKRGKDVRLLGNRCGVFTQSVGMTHPYRALFFPK